MTVMLLALLFSDAALSASGADEYRLVENHDQEDAPKRHVRQWTPRVKSWTVEKADCPVFFQREIAGFGQFRVGPRCWEDDQLPHAL
jgi:hypothetical protein